MAKIEWFIGMTFREKVESIILLISVVLLGIFVVLLFGRLIYVLGHLGEF